MLLDHIHSPNDVKTLTITELNALCEEIRRFLVDQVSHTGGHLAANLGVVELTVAIHRVFNTSEDRLVFDVGHQCYVHKILTGRAEEFSTLRQFGGISGFPKPTESSHDAFIAGHASNSVSVALGMARARTMLHKNYSVIALIGDGALSGGLAYEGLNNAGASGEPMIVILNDNGMSINENVGAMSTHLARLRTKSEYYTFKKAYREILGKSRVGRTIYRFNHAVKKSVKNALLPHATMFEDMGFSYLGPVDGHDLERLIYTLQWAKQMKTPVLIHVRTQKGRGYGPAEREPEKYHGVGPFDAAQGIILHPKEDFSSVFGTELIALATKNEKICAITAAMEDGTGLGEFAKRFPERFFDVGIAEAHACAMAAGLAKQGVIPVFAVYSSFLQRAYDQIVHDVALSNLHVIFAIDRAGIVGADGETHQGTLDPVFLSSIPNLTVLCPSNFQELRIMLHQAIEHFTGPVAIRYPRGGEGFYRESSAQSSFATLQEGTDITLCTYGTMINEILGASQLLANDGIAARVIKLNRIAPFEGYEIRDLFGQTKRLLIAEEASGVGCVGQRIAGILAEQGGAPEDLLLCNLGRRFIPQGSITELRKKYNLDAESLYRAAKEVCHEQQKKA